MTQLPVITEVTRPFPRPGNGDYRRCAPMGLVFSHGRRRTRHPGWNLGAGIRAAVIAEARKALFVMVGFLAILWVVQIANVADHYQLTFSYGIQATGHRPACRTS